MGRVPLAALPREMVTCMQVEIRAGMQGTALSWVQRGKIQHGESSWGNPREDRSILGLGRTEGCGSLFVTCSRFT